MKYQMKNDVVFDAAQWTANNYQEMVDLTGNGFNQGADEDGPWAEVFDEDGQTWAPVYENDYVVYLKEKLFAVLSEGDFEMYFVKQQGDFGLLEGTWNK